MQFKTLLHTVPHAGMTLATAIPAPIGPETLDTSNLDTRDDPKGWALKAYTDYGCQGTSVVHMGDTGDQPCKKWDDNLTSSEIYSVAFISYDHGPDSYKYEFAFWTFTAYHSDTCSPWHNTAGTDQKTKAARWSCYDSPGGKKFEAFKIYKQWT